ncbi:MAG: orotidine-5'-phosphate decarboxylase [bacterium]
MTETMAGPGARLAPKERVAVAFDVETAAAALAARERFGDDLGLAKIGPALFVREGMPLVRAFLESGARVFLDLKFHDIPSVVGKAVEKAVDAGVDYLTVHAAGGPAMIEHAVTAAERGATRVLAVTVLTSLNLDSWRAGACPTEESVEDAVARLARLAVGAGAHGLVGSAHEIRRLRDVAGRDRVIVTPGIRMPGTAAPPDQSRTMTPDEAAREGSDILVVGRGVMQAANPAAALRDVQRAIAEVGS